MNESIRIESIIGTVFLVTGWLAAPAPHATLWAEQSGQSPRSGAVRELSLSEALAEARAGNAELAVAQGRLEVARAESRAASARLWPQLGAEAGYLRSVDPVVAFGTKLRRSTFTSMDFDLERLNDPDAIEDWSAGIGVRWSVLDPRLWAGTAAARHRARFARWSTHRAGEATTLVTRILYYTALHADAQLAATRASEDAARANYETFRKRRERGLLTDADLLQAEAEMAAAEAACADAERARLDALQDLSLHLGWGPDTLPEPTDSLEPPERLPDPGFRPEARADLRALAAAVDAAGATQRQARLDFVPSLDVSASYTKHAGEPFSSDATDWTVSLALRWTLFSGLGRFAQVQRADSEARIARIEYRDALRRARGERAQSERAVAAARQQVEATRAARQAAAAGRELMRRRFEEGLATATDLLQAEARATEMRTRAIAALAAYHIARAQLDFVRSEVQPENP